MKDGAFFVEGQRSPATRPPQRSRPRALSLPTVLEDQRVHGSHPNPHALTLRQATTDTDPLPQRHFTAPVRLTAGNVEWLLVRRCNLEFNVLLYRLVIQHGGTGHDNSTDHNARDGS